MQDGVYEAHSVQKRKILWHKTWCCAKQKWPSWNVSSFQIDFLVYCYALQHIIISNAMVLQFIQQAIRRDFSNIDDILTPPESQDEGVWKYEHLRQFCMELNGLAVKLQVKRQPSSCKVNTNCLYRRRYIISTFQAFKRFIMGTIFLLFFCYTSKHDNALKMTFQLTHPNLLNCSADNCVFHHGYIYIGWTDHGKSCQAFCDTLH